MDDLSTPLEETKRTRGPNKPKPDAVRQRRTSTQVKVALSLLDYHLNQLYKQMDFVKQSVEELKVSLK